MCHQVWTQGPSYISIDYIVAPTKLCFRLSDKFDFHITSNLFRAVQALDMSCHVFYCGIDLASKICEASTAFISTLDNVLIEPCWLKFIYSVLSALT